MELKVQKRLAATALKCSKNRVYFDPERLDEIKESITKADIKALINDHAIKAKPIVGPSKSRTRKIQAQKKKGQRKGTGRRKGKKTARANTKTEWMNKVRKQRVLLKKLVDNEKITKPTYRQMYLKTKGGFFRSVRHIKLYLEEKRLITENGKKKT